MKTIGLIGGISWHSTIEYYRIMNRLMEEKTGGRHTARILIDSLDFGEVRAFMEKQDFDGLAEYVTDSARRLEAAGAGLLLIGANTLHFIASRVMENIRIPLVHIIDATIREIGKKGLVKVGLLGTKFTMEQDFYKKRLAEAGIEAIVPGPGDRDLIQQVILNELVRNILNPESKARILAVIGDLVQQGATGIILGCTEIPLLIRQEDVSVPVFDTTEIHAEAAVALSL